MVFFIYFSTHVVCVFLNQTKERVAFEPLMMCSGQWNHDQIASSINKGSDLVSNLFDL